MKKFFILALSLPLMACYGYRTSDTRFPNDAPNGKNDLYSAIENNNLINNLDHYKTYPIKYYSDQNIRKQTSNGNEETKAIREYPRNVRISANFGQRMIDSEVFTTQTSSDTKPHYIVEDDGVIIDTTHEIILRKGQILYPLGEVKINDKYYLIFNPMQGGRLIIADEHGTIMPTVGYIYKGQFINSYSAPIIRPQNLSVTQSTEKQTYTSEPKLEYEIKYNGVKNGNISLLYIDYTNGSPYEQNFVFPQTQNVINIHGIKLKIIKAAPESVEYIILN